MLKRLLFSFLIAGIASAVLIAQQPAGNLRIVVVASEGGFIKILERSSRVRFGLEASCPSGGLRVTQGTGATCYLDPLAGTDSFFQFRHPAQRS